VHKYIDLSDLPKEAAFKLKALGIVISDPGII